MKNKTIACNCGHREVLENVHTVEDWNENGSSYDLCEECWCDADIVENETSNISNWKFDSKESQQRALNRAD